MPIALVCEMLCALSLGANPAPDPKTIPAIELASTETELAPSDRLRQENILAQLRIQAAIKQAQTAIAAQQYQQAIDRLEQEVASAAGNEVFLELLATAYRAEIASLMKQSKLTQAQMYKERLAVLASVVGSDNPINVANPITKLQQETETKIEEVAKVEEEETEEKPASNPNPLSKAREALTSLTGKLIPGRSKQKTQEDKPEDRSIPVATAVNDRLPEPQLASRSVEKQTPAETKNPAPEITYEVRGKQDALDNSARDAVEPFQKAEQLFREKKYIEALSYYDIAYERDPEQVQPGRARWGYCLLVASIESYNELIDNPNQPLPETVWANLQSDLRLAARLAPSLRSYVDDALARVDAEKKRRESLQTAAVAPTPSREIAVEPASFDTAPAPQVSTAFQHLGQRGGWQVTETRNYIIHHQSTAVAEKLAPLLEKARAFAHQKWFAGEPLKDWQPKCEVFLYPTANDYSRGTGEPAASPGHTKVFNERGRITSRRLNLRLDFPDIERTVLPHEVTHVVLAGSCGADAIPRWADEGMAILCEPRATQEAHLANLANCYQTGNRFTCGQVLTMSDYPPGGRMRDFYAHSVGICRYLVEIGGAEKLVQFLRTALRYNRNYELALQQVYGIRGFQELDAQFGQYVASLQSGNTRLANR